MKTLQLAVFKPESASLTELAGYIVNTHHFYARHELPRIMGQLERVASRYGERFPEIQVVVKLFKELKAEYELHMQKEEAILFPQIKELDEQNRSAKHVKGDIPFLKYPMEHDHDQSGCIMAVIRKLTDNFTTPIGAGDNYRVTMAELETFEMDLNRHSYLENNILFPKAVKLLVG